MARASRILVQLGEQPDGRTAKEVAVALELPLPTTYHLLGTLVAEGFVAKDSRRRYRLGPALGTIADAYVRQFNPPEYLLGPLHRLADETGETVYVVTWRHDRIVVLASVEGDSAVRVSGANLGYVESAHARASGKLLLAFAPEDVRTAYLAAQPARSRHAPHDRATGRVRARARRNPVARAMPSTRRSSARECRASRRP